MRTRVLRKVEQSLVALWLPALLACSGAHQPHQRPAGTADTLRILSYNIHHGEGMDSVVDLARIAALIRDVDPDLVALQEVDSVTSRTDSVDQAAELGSLTGLESLFGSFMPYRGGAYGMALLSRWRFAASENLRLPDGEEPRTALSAVVTLPRSGQRVRFVGIHFYRTDEERLAQAQRLEELLGDDAIPTVLAGDFNSTPGSDVMAHLAESWSVVDKGDDHLTFSSYAPDREIDFVLFRPAERFEVADQRLITEPVASDHRPVVVDLMVRERPSVQVERLLDAPIITPELDSSIGANIQGPSLIKVPDWIEAPLGRYYLYFADHKGRYIRLAYADELLGPWRIYVPGSLRIEDSHFLTDPPDVSPVEYERIRAAVEANPHVSLSHDLLREITTPHIASPDVHVDDTNRRIVMYFHGLEGVNRQVTRVATSQDGIRFEARPEVLGRTYMRAFRHDGYTYAMAMPGQFYRSRDGLSGFEEGPLLFNPDMRHAALLVRDHTLFVFWTQVGQAPERILLSTIDISGDWNSWHESEAVELLRPERDWEGADAPLEPSVRSTAYGHVNQLRDPAVYEEDGRTYLLYALAGESGIAIAEVHFER